MGVIGQALTRKRRIERVTGVEPLRVVQRETGRIDIIDDASGLTVELMSYGKDNIAVFANLLKE